MENHGGLITDHASDLSSTWCPFNIWGHALFFLHGGNQRTTENENAFLFSLSFTCMVGRRVGVKSIRKYRVPK